MILKNKSGQLELGDLGNILRASRRIYYARWGLWRSSNWSKITRRVARYSYDVLVNVEEGLIQVTVLRRSTRHGSELPDSARFQRLPLPLLSAVPVTSTLL